MYIKEDEMEDVSSIEKDRSFELIKHRNSSKNIWFRVGMILLSALVYAICLNCFLNGAGVLPAGFGGLSMLIQRIGHKYFNVEIPYSFLYIGFNAIPCYMAYKEVGRRFVLLSFLHIVVSSILVDILPKVKVIENDMLLVVVCAAVVHGVAAVLSLNADASQGGTDFVGMLVANRIGRTIWNEIFAFNMIVLLTSAVLFSVNVALYSIIFQYLCTVIINRFYKRYQRNTIMLVTEEVEPMATDLMKLTHHGVTTFECTGEYSGKKKYMLYMVVSRQDMPAIHEYIKNSKKKIFMNIMDSRQLSGRFYLRPLD